MKKIIYVVCLLFLVACSSSPLDKEFNEATLEKDLKEIRDSKALDSAESVMLVKYFMRAKLKGENLKGKTYADLLAAAKAEEKSKGDGEANNNAGDDGENENYSLADKVEGEQNEKVAKLKATIDVNFVGKEFFGEEARKYMSYEFTFKNNSNKEIKAVNGDVAFSDLEGNEIKVITLKYEGAIKPNETIKYASSADYNANDGKDIIINAKKKNELVMQWNPKSIMYSDGSSVE